VRAKEIKVRIYQHQQQMIKIHSHCLSHSHQLHTPQSDIAQRPNAHWMKHSGQACNHAATKDKKKPNSILASVDGLL
jgi:hypothetical protein